MDNTYNSQEQYQYVNDLHRKVSGAIINRINFPKREAKAIQPSQMRGKVVIDRHGKPKRKYEGTRPFLSDWDCLEVRQTVAMVLSASGAIHRDKLTLADWRACFYASRVLLRIDRIKSREDATDIATLDKIPVTVEEPARFTARRAVIARHARHYRDCIAAAFSIDKSRQRKHNRDKAHSFLRLLVSQATASGLGQSTITAANDLSGLRHAAATFRRYIDTGETAMERQSTRDVAIREAELATTEHGEAKTFRALTYKRGRKVALAA